MKLLIKKKIYFIFHTNRMMFEWPMCCVCYGDVIGDGLIQHRELQHVMRACMEENGMQFSEDQVIGLDAFFSNSFLVYIQEIFEVPV